jgi:hypothetical protein
MCKLKTQYTIDLWNKYLAENVVPISNPFGLDGALAELDSVKFYLFSITENNIPNAYWSYKVAKCSGLQIDAPSEAISFLLNVYTNLKYVD